MISRTILTHLNDWKKRPDRKPLILRGARQVGKTTVVDLFSKTFENYIYLNLELGRDRSIFENDLTVSEIYQAIRVIKNITPKEGDTLLFIDEIQNSPQAVALLRYFYEDLKTLHVIGAGSLMEMMLEKTSISFPVGRVEYRYMFPMTFTEYLSARREDQLLEIMEQIPLKPFAHSKLLGLFHEYTMIGGMPEIVATYVKTGQVSDLNRIYETLLISYVNDVEKYARNQTLRQILRHCIESIPFETGKRIKFQGFGRSNYRSREVGEALRTIERAMLLYLIYPSASVQIPIFKNQKKSPKLQFFDTGLLNYFVGLQPAFYQFDDLHGLYQGMIAEHIVRQELLALNPIKMDTYCFWSREKKQSNAEIDVLIPYRNHIIPVEVKAGASGTLKSLHQFMDQTDHDYAVRCYSGPLNITDSVTPAGKAYHLLNLPYFLTGGLYQYLEWMMREH